MGLSLHDAVVSPGTQTGEFVPATDIRDQLNV